MSNAGKVYRSDLIKEKKVFLILDMSKDDVINTFLK